jgi:sodium:solute symporter family protein
VRTKCLVRGCNLEQPPKCRLGRALLCDRISSGHAVNCSLDELFGLAWSVTAVEVSASEKGAISGGAASDDVLLLLLHRFAPCWLAGLLGAGIMAAVMASDSQILALSTMFTEDVFAFYGGKSRFGETVQVATGRIFVIAVTVFAYAVAMRAPQAIFDIAVQLPSQGMRRCRRWCSRRCSGRTAPSGERCRRCCGWQAPL